MNLTVSARAVTLCLIDLYFSLFFDSYTNITTGVMSDSSDSDSIADSIETSSQIDASIGSKSSAQLLAAAGAGEEENTPRPRSNESSDGHDGRAEEESHNDTVDDVALLEYAEYRDGSKTPEYGAEGLVKLWDRPKEEDISEHPNKVLNDLE